MIQGMMHMHLDVALPEKWLPEKIRTGDSHFIMGMNIFLFFFKHTAVSLHWCLLDLPALIFSILFILQLVKFFCKKWITHKMLHMFMRVCVTPYCYGPAWPRNISDVLSNQGPPMWVIFIFPFFFFPQSLACANISCLISHFGQQSWAHDGQWWQVNGNPMRHSKPRSRIEQRGCWVCTSASQRS